MPKVFREPGHRLIGNGWCKMVPAAELTEDDVVSIFAQAGDEQPTGHVDWQNAVNRAVRDEYQRLATPNTSRDVTGREGDDAAEQIAVCQA